MAIDPYYKIATYAGKKSWLIIRPVLAQRKLRAGNLFDPDMVGSILDYALNVLGQNAQSILQKIQIETTRTIAKPLEQFSYPYVQKWINDERTRKALKEEVINAFNGREDRSNIEAAAVVYEEISSEDRRNAYGLIHYALAFLAQPISDSLSLADRMIIDTINTRAGESEKSFEELKEGQKKTTNAIRQLKDNIESNFKNIEGNLDHKQPKDVIDQFVQKEMDRAVKRRWFTEANPLEELLSIATRVDGDDLSHASLQIKNKLFREMAAAYARKESCLRQRIGFKKLKRVPQKQMTIAPMKQGYLLQMKSRMRL